MQLGTVDEERMRKIRQLEAMGHKAEEIKDQVFQKPVFTTPLNSVDNLVEASAAIWSAALNPSTTLTSRSSGHRFRTTHDFGYVALDILYSYAEDSGTYLCKATNKMGEAVNSCNVTVSARRSIYLDTQHPMGWEKIQSLEHRAATSASKSLTCPCSHHDSHLSSGPITPCLTRASTCTWRAASSPCTTRA
ncbi:Kettin [Penaeus vannamei]|uniref:Kettin n=1 Tax=Penaeus vannamei TaxID=6689 RepID=A0A3R7SYQ8_PENVA|nr:Kettin [Penaeus vannamei]